MQLPQYTKSKDFLIFLRVVPLMVVVFNAIIFGKVYFNSFYNFFLASIITFLIIATLWISLTWIAVAVRNWFSKDKDLIKRVGIMVILAIISSTLMLTFIFYGYDHYHFLGYQLNESRYNWAMAIMVIINIFVTFAHEGASNFEKWRDPLVETEQLRKEFMQSQLLGLKSQVNPHFLFNSLNSLSSLISEDPDKAEKFLDEMSKVYRYLLRTNEDGLTTLDAEMQFIHSYFHMLKTRYTDGLEMETQISDQYLEYLLPPLTLQMLVENAVKHNMILKNSPLKILIMTTNSGKLIVSNNLQRKDRKVSSNKVGLSNIVNKYRLMRQEEIAVRDDGKEFAVVVPLIQSITN